MERDLLNRNDAEIEEFLKASGFLNAKRGLKNLRLLSSTAIRPSLEAVLRSAIDSPSPDNALNNLEGIIKDLPQETLDRLNIAPLNLSQLVTVCGSSNYLSGLLSGHPEWLKRLFLDAGLNETKGLVEFRKDLEPAVASSPSFEAALEALRIYRNKEFLRLGCRDILGLASLEEVVAGLSDLASASLDAACGFAISELKKRFGSPFYTDEDGVQKEAVFAVIGLGKLGGMELNFSSDIDIMYIYSSDKGETSGIEGVAGSRLSLHGFFSKAAASITRLLSASTEHGFVFRVDLDLRPDGKKGDAANSLRSAEVYYEAWGKPWERGALIKARPVAGDERLGADFLSMITPFVYRKYLDFMAIEEIKSMKEKIDLSPPLRKGGVDVKLGTGGIREIEFFCQTLQLVHGGKDLSVRERGTLRALDILRDRQYIKDSEAETLKKAYRFLRNIEHRLQLVEGRQTQAIPAKAEALERLARMMGFKDSPEAKAGQGFWEEYRNVTSSVHEVFRTLFYKKAEEGAESSADVLTLLSPETGEDESKTRLKSLGFKDPVSAYKNLCLLRSAQTLTRMTARAQVLLQKLLPLCISRAASCPEPDMALAHLAQFISAIGPRLVFYSLLYENPLIIDELISVFSASVFLSRSLIERPENLDILLSRELSVPYKQRGAFFAAFLKEAEGKEKDYEERLDSLRRLRNQEVIRIAINDIRGSLTPRQVSFQLSFLAEACIEAAFILSSAELKRAYGALPEARFTVLGMGKLGSRELIYGSDLDIVFVYSGVAGPDEKTTGPKKISAHEFFVKLGQRIISILSLRTKEGVLGSVDVRLRPSGSAGPLVLSESALLNYHRGKTMVWERQSLIKARAVAGDIGLGEEVLNGLRETIYSRAFQEDDIREMLRIRRRMEDEIAKEDSSRYNIKTGKGGLVDIEFLAQAMQMRYGLDKNGLRTQDTLKALKRLNIAALLSDGDYKTLKEAYLFYRLLEMKLRVVHDRAEGVINAGSPELNALARRAGDSEADSGDRLLKRYRDIRETVRGIYLKTIEGFLRL